MVAVGFWFDIFQVLNSGNNSLQSIPFSEVRLTIGMSTAEAVIFVGIRYTM